MQTKKGTIARGPTSEEFLHVMEYFREEAFKVAKRHPHIFTQGCPPLFSFDNPPIHNKAPLASIGMQQAERVDLPPCSPDMHKVIEHVFGSLTGGMNASLARDPALRSTPMYKAELERLFHAMITPEGVGRDVESLPDTYQGILDVGGGWPDKTLR